LFKEDLKKKRLLPLGLTAQIRYSKRKVEFALSNIIEFEIPNRIENRLEHIFRSDWIRTVKSDKMQMIDCEEKEENAFQLK